MATKIGLRRMGAKKVPFYRIVVADSRALSRGRFIDQLGWYDPLRKRVQVDKEKVLDWISKGAELTNSVKKLLVNFSIVSRHEMS
ncbi:MAG: 30S ribosomal protein S16 [bacterium]